MNIDVILTTTVTVLLALLGYLITYVNNIRIDQRKERLNRINRQLGEFYGPLYALIRTGDTVWDLFRSRYRSKNIYYFDPADPPTEEELEAWHLWMAAVFMPLNVRMYELILTKADLLIGSEMPECLLELCAHVAAYQAVLKKWENNDFTELAAPINFPAKELLEYSQKSFSLLKTQQAKLLGENL